jgi:hypothetical protein
MKGLTMDHPPKTLETLEAAHAWAKHLSVEHGCIYSVQNDGHRYRVQAGGSNAVTHVASYFDGRRMLERA